MRKVWTVIRREFLEKVRTKAFIIGTIAFPLLLVGFAILPAILATRQTAPRRIAVVDGTEGQAGQNLTQALAASRRSGPKGAQRYAITRIPAIGRVTEVRDSLIAITGLREGGSETYDGVLVIDDPAVDAAKLTYYGANVASQSDMRRLEEDVAKSLRFERLIRAGIDPIVAQPALKPITLSTAKVTDGRLSGESGETSFALAYAMVLILYIALLIYGIQVMTSVLEEKSSRIAEVMVSSLTPFQMMLGKVMGVGLVALLQLSIWGGTAVLVTTYRGQVAKLLGLPSEAVASAVLPAIKPDLLGVFLLYFILGFLLFAAMYAAVAAMCNSIQETQQLNAPITMCIVAGFIAVFSLLNEPAGPVARVLSMVPVVAPLVVPVRYSLAPIPFGELALSVGILLATVIAVVWVAARIYRVGILMYGKRPSLREVWRWVRTS